MRPFGLVSVGQRRRRAHGGSSVVRIADFDAADSIALHGSAFGGLGTGMLAANAFQLGSEAVDRYDRIIYDSSSGDLSFDADGSGMRFDRIVFAHVDNHALLAASDFFVI